MGRLFGTDGIRGVAGKFPLTSKDVLRVAHAAGDVLRRHASTDPIRVFVVRDTRASGVDLVQTLTQGLREKGIDVYDGDVLSTPSVAYMVRAHRFQSGVVVSASHNPPQFNGIKFFNHQGRKWPDAWEEQVETLFFRKTKAPRSKHPFGHRVPAHSLALDYEKFLLQTLPGKLDLSHIKIAVDCAHGATYEVGPQVLRQCGAKLTVMGNKPNGTNINVRCGSQHTQALAKIVKRTRAHCGIGFDGDGDRVVFLDQKGHEVDGDYLIALLAKYYQSKKMLKNRKAVITVMANLGLRKALSRLGIRSVETPVGDRYVSEAMRKHNSILGGEQSGHIILGSHLPSGDGLLTALHVLYILQESKKPFSKLVGWMKKYPQVLVNVPVKEKKPIPALNGVQDKIHEIEKILGQDGRILVRYSGTEPLLRIMIEGPNEKAIGRYATELVDEVKSATR